MIQRTELLRPEYLALLRNSGLAYLVQPPPQDALHAAEEDVSARWRNATSPPTEVELSSRLAAMRRIGARAQQEGWSWEQVWLDVLAAELDAAVPRVAEEFVSANTNVQFYVGVFPTGMFNAQACQVSGGFLVLINQGLMMLLYQTMRVYSWAVRDVTDPSPPADGKTRMALGLTDALRAYLETGHSATAAPLEPVAGRRAVPGNLILTAMERFVLAHEYGHVIAGHLQDARRERVGNLTLLMKQRDDEFLADALGTMLLIAALNLPDVETFNDYAGLKLSCEIAGPIFSLEVGALVLRAQRAWQGLPEEETLEELAYSDHPAPGLRIYRIKQLLREHGLGQYLSVAETAQTWLHDVGDLSVAQLKAMR